MESPVMTSASSHRLRSAVSACAQPTHSYLSSSYLATSIRCEPHDSGGCFKKFYNSGRNGESSHLDKLNATKKPHDHCLPGKRHKVGGKAASTHSSGTRNHLGSKNDVGGGRETKTSSTNGLLNLVPKRFATDNDFFSGLKVTGNLLAGYLENGVEKCETGKASNGRSEGGENESKSDEKNLGVSPRKKDGAHEESELECPKCGVAHLAERIKNKRQESVKWQPRHAATRRTAQIVRDLQNVLGTTLGSSKLLPEKNLQSRFNDPQLYLPASAGSEMLDYAKEGPEKVSTTLLAPNDYEISNKLLKNSRESKAHKGSRVIQSAPIPIPSRENVDRHNRKFSRGMSKYEVFLGGSCNPTTWRTDVAIPQLESMGIKYYNPQQVEEWSPELLEVEYHAKENATVMFFVIDNQTRGVSALIEVAHLAGNQRKLILVIQSYMQKNQVICNEVISESEYEDLKMGQEVLQDLVERQGIPVFNDISIALKCTEKILRENLTVQDLQQPVHVNRDESLNPQEVFEKLDSDNLEEISASDVCLGLKMLSGVTISVDCLNSFISNELDSTNMEKFDSPQFSQLVEELRKHQEEGELPDFLPNSTDIQRDVYLGGTMENTSWRESIAIPMLKSHSLTYFTPQIREELKRFTEVEAAAMDNSFILLFVITKTARSIPAMAIAGHYIGKGANVVLCVEHLPEEATIGDEILSPSAVKDYNRGRMYLMDIAKRNGVPVFEEITTVVDYVIQQCGGR